MNLIKQLTEVYCDNFVAYYRAHSCHFNVTGRNFHSDHELLGDIYEDAQAQIDPLGELIRTLNAEAPETISDILSTASLKETTTFGAEGMLAIVLEAQEHLINCYRELEEAADNADHDEIANYAQDRISAHEKFAWMLRSTLS